MIHGIRKVYLSFLLIPQGDKGKDVQPPMINDKYMSNVAGESKILDMLLFLIGRDNNIITLRSSHLNVGVFCCLAEPAL